MDRIEKLMSQGGMAMACAFVLGLLLAGCGGGSGQPDAPTIGTATAGNGEATVNFTPPVNNGGAEITLYTVSSTPGNFTASGSASPIIVTGLTNSVAYRFTVTATNIGGTSVPSSPSNSVTPSPLVPSAPIIGIASVGNAQASVNFTPPVNNGGVAINYYTVTSTPGYVTAVGTSSPIAVTGLSNGTAYSFTVTATNSAGTSPASAASNSVLLTGAIASMPFSGTSLAGSSTAYTYTTQAAVNKIAVSGTPNVQVFTDISYSVLDTNWTCSTHCLATTPVPAGTILYIGVNNFTATAAAFTLDVSNASVMLSEGAVGAPKLINTLPYNGVVGPVVVATGVGISYYQYTTAASTGSLTALPISDTVEPAVYTNATFGALDQNWDCITVVGTCTAATPVPAGTVLYIAINYFNAGPGATFTLKTP